LRCRSLRYAAQRSSFRLWSAGCRGSRRLLLLLPVSFILFSSCSVRLSLVYTQLFFLIVVFGQDYVNGRGFFFLFSLSFVVGLFFVFFFFIPFNLRYPTGERARLLMLKQKAYLFTDSVRP
jgi:hypothetical protein